MKKLLLTLLFAIPILGFCQTLTNKTFDANVNGWAAGAVTATVSHDAVEGAAAAGSLKLVATVASDRAQTSPNLAPISGAGDYTLTFKVKGPAGNKVQGVSFQTANIKSGASLTLTGGWDTYTAILTGISTAVMNLRLVAVDPGTYYFDDVQWTYNVPIGNTTLTTAVSGPGSLAVSPIKPSYLPTDVVTLTATPKSHSIFNGWSGDLTGTTNPANLTMSTNKTVTANFVVDPTFNYAFYFNTIGDQEGWSNTTDTNLAVSQSAGLVTLTPTANQFARYSLTGFPIPAASFNKLTVKLQNNSATTNQLSIIVNNGTTQSVIPNTITTSDAGFVTYDFYLNPAVYTSWTGTISDLRLRFADAANANVGKPSDASTIVIDDIILTYDSSLSTGDINKSKNLLQVYVTDNNLNFLNATVNKVTIYNMNGQVVKNTQVIGNKTDVSNLKSGIYIIKTLNQDRSESVTKFIKK